MKERDLENRIKELVKKSCNIEKEIKLEEMLHKEYKKQYGTLPFANQRIR